MITFFKNLKVKNMADPYRGAPMVAKREFKS